MRAKVLCMMGPTAAGKTAAAIALAQEFPVEIVSVDSAMIYRGMDIGTAKPSAAEQQLAPHRLLDIRDPCEIYSVGQFCVDARCAINDIVAAGKTPLLVGGTMMYFNALQRGLAALPAADPAQREKILRCAQEQGWAALHKRLQRLDPQAAEQIHPNDKQRIQRALEVIELTGKPLSAWWQKQSADQDDIPFSFVNIGLMLPDRQCLHARIAQRWEAMIQQGFVDEVKALYQRGDLRDSLPSMRCVGYRQGWQHCDNRLTFAQMQEKALTATRQLAKRQLTWLRQWPKLHTFDLTQPAGLEQLVGFVREQLAV